MRRLVIAGIGNTLMTDDGIGPAIIRELNRHYDLGDGVEALDVGLAGANLNFHLQGARAVILIDAMDMGRPPGEIIVRSGPDVETSPLSSGSHSGGLSGTLRLMDLEGGRPETIVLVAVQGHSFEFGEQLSTAVAAAVPRAVLTVVEEAARLGVELRKR